MLRSISFGFIATLVDGEAASKSSDILLIPDKVLWRLGGKGGGSPHWPSRDSVSIGENIPESRPENENNELYYNHHQSS